MTCSLLLISDGEYCHIVYMLTETKKKNLKMKICISFGETIGPLLIFKLDFVFVVPLQFFYLKTTCWATLLTAWLSCKSSL